MSVFKQLKIVLFASFAIYLFSFSVAYATVTTVYSTSGTTNNNIYFNTQSATAYSPKIGMDFNVSSTTSGVFNFVSVPYSYTENVNYAGEQAYLVIENLTASTTLSAVGVINFDDYSNTGASTTARTNIYLSGDVTLLEDNTYRLYFEYTGDSIISDGDSFAIRVINSNISNEYVLVKNDPLTSFPLSDPGFTLMYDDEYVPPEPPPENTRIIDFGPADNSTTTSPVDFFIDAYISPNDIDEIKGIKLSLHNIDQNVLLLGFLSPSDIYFLDDDMEAGFFNFATTTPLGDGNYRLEACIERTYLWGIFENPFDSVTDCQSHQFIVGESTFIGNISQNSFDELDEFFNGTSATTSEALSKTCNPISTNYDIRLCAGYLFIPSADSMKEIIENLRSGVLTRAPWGYLTRTYNIFSDEATSTLPSFTTTIRTGENSTTSLFFDPADMIAGGAQLLDEARDPYYDKNVKDVTYPMIQLFVALSVLIVIVKDITNTDWSGGNNSKDT